MSVRNPPTPDYVLKSVEGEVTAVEFGTFFDDLTPCIITGHHNGNLQIWDLNTYRTRFTWSAHSGSRSLWMAVLSDNSIISHGRDGLVHFWKIYPTKPPECTDTLSSTCSSHCTCSLANHHLAVPQDESRLDVIDITTKDVYFTCRIDDRKLGSLMCTKLARTTSENDDDDHLLSFCGYENGSIVLFNRRGRLSWLDVYAEPVMCLDFNVETMRGITGGTDTRLVVWQMSSTRQLTVVKTVELKNEGCACVLIHPRALYVAVATWDNRLRIFSWKSMKALAVFTIHEDSVQSLAFSRHPTIKTILAAGARDARVSLWSLYN